ncbi:MAG: MarR family transcriptional regulator [Leptonema illini]|uniref:Regulatory protein MarR n=3 Tax=Leptonema illini TaxID=183 RepID=H2CB87_9LEPT|nr:regulatory protein MarR [Leptonema illini DSM 21528]KAB2932175.1 MAG: MarR family transcriptional regulator [Leptonema illini]PKL29926.1 MAG: hypothetical protein CVV45_20145 [Spirochaetae bacterium HGW-Spirochaetae-10]
MKSRSMQPEPPQTSDPLGYLLGRAHYSMRRRLNRRMASCGMELTSEQCLILVMLGCESQVNQQDLADRMFKDKTGISRLVSGMERKGLIQRTSTIEDRRNNFVQLTDFGRSTLSTIQKQLSEIRVEAREGIAEKDMETCRRVLQKLVDNLSACEEQAG